MTRSGEAVCEAFCSTANLAAGFDVFGLALNRYSDKVKVRITSQKKVRILLKGRYRDTIPIDERLNSAGPPAHSLLREARLERGLLITIEKNVPPGIGLGSSGATAAACTKAIDHVLDLRLSSDRLVQVASLGEKVVSGSAHPDNVAASLLGGFVIVYDVPFKTISTRPPSNLAIVIVNPDISLRENKTRLARKLVPKKLDVKKAVLNIGRASAIATGFALGDIEMIGSGMVDEIAEPSRERLIPGYRAVKKAASGAGAAGVSISGAGPSVIGLVDRDRHSPRLVAKEMVRTFSRNNVHSTFFVARPAAGARILRGNPE